MSPRELAALPFEDFERLCSGPAVSVEVAAATLAAAVVRERELRACLGALRAEAPAADSLSGESAAHDSGTHGESHKPTVRALLDLFSVEGNSDGVYYNEANDYGVLTLRLHTGEGDPFKLYLGEEVMGEFATGRRGREWRGTGRYKLNDALVELLLARLQQRQAEG